ncbi:MAG: hypothetical protein CMK02_07960 [Polycyclovorans sp.]|nr:hypothetical protein [Rhodospirillaceae bacterium]MAY26216.1 hypothetical protein [Polycyclovorans sp.]MAX61579.1 hypothetical protein [Rhodospirillaceae bacterium]MAX61644.1 hypothetical protein [Rhodospirillaceae bacterium]MAX61709.1 hypothetical protein [Rhodospirillaceae bacterium]
MCRAMESTDSPLNISSSIRCFHVMQPNLQDTVSARQQHSVTAFCDYRRMESVGDRIKKARARAGMSRTELSKRSKVGYSTIAEIENGGMRSSTKLHQLAAPLGVSVEYLATGKEAPTLALPAPPLAIAGPASTSETRRIQQREGGWIGAKMTPAQQSLLRAVELMGRTIPDERAKALAELVLLSGGPVDAPPKITA